MIAALFLLLCLAVGVVLGVRTARVSTATDPYRCAPRVTPPGRLVDKGEFMDVTRWWEAI